MINLDLDFILTTTARVIAEFDQYEKLAKKGGDPRAVQNYKKALSNRYQSLVQLNDVVLSTGLDFEKYKKNLGLSDDYISSYKKRCYSID